MSESDYSDYLEELEQRSRHIEDQMYNDYVAKYSYRYSLATSIIAKLELIKDVIIELKKYDQI